MTPERISRYEIETELGRGAMGRVFRAHDPEIDRTVAIKLVRADLLEGEARDDYLRRFRQEAQAAARCVHPNIVTIYDYATDTDGNPFLAMEYVPGRPLREAGRAIERIEPGACAGLALQLLDGLAAAHAVGVVHRDIKPANLLVLPDGRLKITDFGISRLDTSHLTGAGDLVGTPSYMSPEQCRGEPVDARTDLFSAGVVMFELLSGVRPFAGGDAASTMRRLMDDIPADLSPLPQAVPAAMRAVVARALAKPAGERFGSAAGMASALRAAMSGSDLTVVVPVAPASAPGLAPVPVAVSAGPAGLPAEMLARVEASLASAIGPIARRVLRDAASRARTEEELGQLAGAAIADESLRARFLRGLASDRAGRSMTSAAAAAAASSASSAAAGSSLPVAGSLSDAEVQQVERELTRLVGPIARVLVRRAAPGVAGVGALREALASHIERPEDRSAFLLGRPR